MTKFVFENRPDHFGAPSYQGVVVATPDQQFGRDQARYAFANGFGAGVIFGGDELSCLACQDAEHPYELHALHGNPRDDPALCERYVGHVCVVDAAGVRHWLGLIAALPSDTTCAHTAESFADLPTGPRRHG